MLLNKSEIIPKPNIHAKAISINIQGDQDHQHHKKTKINEIHQVQMEKQKIDIIMIWYGFYTDNPKEQISIYTHNQPSIYQ